MSQFKKLALEITKREGLKKSVNIAQVSEILRVLGDIAAEKPVKFLAWFYHLEAKPAVKKKAKKRK